MLRALGGLPTQRTPLNARTTAVLDRDGYRIEKVIFESQPRFYVVANLYLPKTGKPPYPAVLYPLGHELGAKAHSAWQYMLVTLAKRGYVALTWDPIGQGERSQFFETGLAESMLGFSTTEHIMVGLQCLLVGDNLARYTIWDGMRALDYLLSRKEVDPTRIACTGNSGGGTLTAYLSVLEDRIHVAAPSCWITSWRWQIGSIGPQDAESNIPPWLADGLDQADFIIPFAPKPFLMLTAIRDYFSISGARETFAEARRIYDVAGAPEKISMFEADDSHGYSKPRREAAYRWLSRWLKGAEDNEPELAVELESEQTLNVTETGQVATSLAGETVFSLNIKRFEQMRFPKKVIRDPQALISYHEEIRRKARELTGFNPRTEALKVHPFGVITRSGYRIEKLVYESEPGILVPALLFLPEKTGRRPGVVYVHGSGKSSNFAHFYGDYRNAMKALLIGKPLVGMRAEDIVRGVDLLGTRPEVDPEQIYGFGCEAGGVPLLHAAALDPRMRKVAIEGALISYESVVRNMIHRDVCEHVIQGVLKSYDLPEIVATLAPRAVWIVNPIAPTGQRVPMSQVRKEYATAMDAFAVLGAEGRIKLAERRPGESIFRVYREFLGVN